MLFLSNSNWTFIIMPRPELKKITRLILLFLFTGCNTLPVANKNKNVNTEHLKSKAVQEICAKIDSTCSFYSFKLCAVRLEDGKLLYREFKNDCELFLVNMCEYPGREWAIKEQIPCTDPNPRRAGNESAEYNEPDEGTTESNVEDSKGSDDVDPAANGDPTEDRSSESENGKSTKNGATDDSIVDNAMETTENAALRVGRWIFTTVIYPVERAIDGDKCPQYCPSIHAPVCVNVNRAHGRYFQLLHFSNHCEADRHICANINTVYKQPEGLKVPGSTRISTAAYSNCASNSYMNFVTFTQTASSMAHYGWLAGPQRAQFIVDPHLRLPGTG